MRRALDREIDQVGQGELGPSQVELTSGTMPPEDGSDLEVDEFRGGQVFTSKSRASQVAIATVVSQRDREHAGINDEHARTAMCSPIP
jgi:hypothetical protein